MLEYSDKYNNYRHNCEAHGIEPLPANGEGRAMSDKEYKLHQKMFKMRTNNSSLFPSILFCAGSLVFRGMAKALKSMSKTS